MVHDGVRQSYPSRGRLGRVLDGRNPPVLLGKELVPREEGARVSVWADPEEEEVEYGEPCSLFLCEFGDQFLFVGVADIFEFEGVGVGAVGRDIDCLDVLGGDRDFGEEGVGGEFMV